MYLSGWQIGAIFFLGNCFSLVVALLIFGFIRRKVMEALFGNFLQALEGVAIQWFVGQAEQKAEQVNATITGAAQKAAQTVHDKYVTALPAA